MRKRKRDWMNATILCMLTLLLCIFPAYSSHSYAGEHSSDNEVSANEGSHVGGGYAATGQYINAGYTSKIYDATNGLPTSDANYILGASDGYLWIGGYSGIIRYDGTSFTRLDASTGLTNGRGLFEDSKGRIWVGTNDNGVIVIDGSEQTHFTYQDGLPSSSIRIFAEDEAGNVYIGTTAGVCYADADMKIRVLDDERINEERVLRLDSDPDGTVYGQTKNGLVFEIKDQVIVEVYSRDDLGMEKITSILADPETAGKVYICTDKDAVYHGRFGDTAEEMERISVAPLSGIHWISYDCDRLWVSSTTEAGYLDEKNRFHLIDDLPMNSGIEMMTSDYQGNMWFASSTQGVMKVITNSFVNLSEKAGLPEEVTNATCLYGNELYIGTDKGVQILDEEGNVLMNELTDYVGDSRVRCIAEGKDADLWIGTFTNGLGLIHYTKDGEIISFTKENGMPDNELRCIAVMEDGKGICLNNLLLAIIRNDRVVQTIGAADGIGNTIFLTVEEGDDGSIYVGTDGDGIYVIEGTEIRRIGRDEGLTSDVVSRIIKDDERDVYWLITSNSIEYMRGEEIVPVSTFPYNNNYALNFDHAGNMWIVSSYGIYMVSTDDMLADNVSDYRLYTVENGLTDMPTSYAYCALSEDGDLYIPGRNGVCRVNIDHFSVAEVPIKASISSVYCGEELIFPDSSGMYTLPASDDRIRISAAVLDYTFLNPEVDVYLEGQEENGIKTTRSALVPLEYTGLDFGDYTLHIRVLDSQEKIELLDETVQIRKQPRLLEVPVIRVLLVLFMVIAAGLIVWRVTKSTIIRKQYQEIKQAKEEAEKASSSKSRFLANMSYEIRTPINMIMGMNEMAIREDAAGVPKPYFKSMMNYAFGIRNASESLLYLINDLLDLSRIESGRMHLTEQEYDTQEMLRAIVSPIRILSTRKELTFDVRIDEALPSRMYGDTEKIKQILVHLLTNALKYTDIGGCVLDISMVERKDDECKIRFLVKDSGIGISEEDIRKLFTAYEQLEEEERTDIRESGLGFDISYRLSKLMGGSLTCTSENGKGTEFTLTLDQKIIDKTPIGVFVELDERKERESHVVKFVAPDADILVVDDTPANLNIIKGLLRPTKVFVTTASSGEECLEKMRDTRFYVVLLDLMMPGMDGMETVERIRKLDPNLPVYALTDSNDADEAFFRSKGFNGYLKRPIDSETLEQTIMKHLPEAMMEKE